jgi:hypothetical protein
MGAITEASSVIAPCLRASVVLFVLLDAPPRYAFFFRVNSKACVLSAFPPL